MPLLKVKSYVITIWVPVMVTATALTNDAAAILRATSITGGDTKRLYS